MGVDDDNDGDDGDDFHCLVKHLKVQMETNFQLNDEMHGFLSFCCCCCCWILPWMFFFHFWINK